MSPIFPADVYMTGTKYVHRSNRRKDPLAAYLVLCNSPTHFMKYYISCTGTQREFSIYFLVSVVTGFMKFLNNI